MGEPRSSGTNVKRDVLKTIRLSAADWDVISRRMRATGQNNFSKFARELLTTGAITVASTRRDLSGVERQLAALGNNLNQIARNVNAQHLATQASADEARAIMVKVHELIGELQGTHGDRENQTDSYNTQESS